MVSNRNETNFSRETRAALAGLRDALPATPADPALLSIPLARVGDALRLGIELPPPVRTWSNQLGDQHLAGVCRALTAEAQAWSLPAPGAPVEDDEETAFVVRRRDEAESVNTALARICLGRRTAPIEIDGFGRWLDVLEAFDARLATVATRAAVEQLLGERAALLGAHGWTSALPEGNADGTSSTEPVAGVPLHATPPDEIVLRYATEGVFARSVEGYAGHDPEFAEALASVIDGLLEAREPVGLTARRWRKAATAQFPAVIDAAVLSVRPRLRLAAATENTPVARTEMILGKLDPVDADARLLCTADRATLEVFDAAGVVRRVEFGAAVATAPVAGDRWSVDVAASNEPLTVHVIDAAGQEFTLTVQLAAEDEPAPGSE